VVEASDGRIVAEVLLRATKGVRVNFRDSLPKDAPREVKRVVRATRSAGQWAAFAYADDADAPMLREAIHVALQAREKSQTGSAVPA
jgi:hypothetical protein